MKERTTVNLSIDHGTAVRHAAVELGLNVTTVAEKLVEGDKKVCKCVAQWWQRVRARGRGKR